MTIPEDLDEAVKERFGLGTVNDNETLRRALWYAVEAYDLEHGRTGSTSDTDE